MRPLTIMVTLVATLITLSPPCQDEAASPETQAESATLDISQVNFRLVRVASQQEYAQTPDAFDLLEATSLDGLPITLPIDPVPLLHVMQLDHAVIEQDMFGLYHLQLFFTQSDAEAYSRITADHAGQRGLWLSRDNILKDLLFTGRETSGAIVLFYGDSPLERIENVVQVLQLPYTIEVSEDLIVPESRADEFRLEAMRAFRLQRREEGVRALAQALALGGPDYAYRPQLLLVMGSTQLEEGDLPSAWTCFEEIRQNHPDFPDMIAALRGLRTIAAQEGSPEAVLQANREILDLTGGQGEDALEAQRQTVQILWTGDPQADRTIAETRLMVNMLQNHMAQLPRSERFEYELELIIYYIRLNQDEDWIHVINSRLRHMPRDPAVAANEMMLICDVLQRTDRLSLAAEQLDAFIAAFEAEYDTDSERVQEILGRLNEIRDQVQTAVGDSSAPTE